MAQPGPRAFDPRIWLLAIGTFATGTDSFVIAGILPELAKSFGITISTAGYMVSSYALVYGLGTPILAVIVARWRQDRVALVSLIAFIVVNLLCTVAPDFAFLLVMRVAAGLCAAVYAPSAYALAAAFARPEKRGGALAAVALGSSGSTVVGVPLGTYIGQALDWRATFLLVALLTLIGILALIWRGPHTATDLAADPQPLKARIAPLGRGRVWLVLAPVLLLFCAIYIVYTYIVPLLETHYQAAQVPLFLTIYGLGGLAGSQLGGKLVDSFGATRPLVFVLVLFALFQIAFPFSLSSPVLTALV
ncbi:MAG: MFS transporter, partial [Stellaceae bacterium]